jgi:hypothetical protein
MIKAVRHAVRIGVAALLLGGLASTPAMAADDSSPDAQYYQSSVTQIQPAVPGLEVKVRSSDGQLTLINHTGKTVTVVGLSGEDYLRVTPNGAEENTSSLTSAINAKAGNGGASTDQLAGAAAGAGAAANWVKRGDQPTTTWKDYRVLWTNKQRPPIVASDPHSAHKVFSWAVNLKVGSQPVLVLGDVMWTGTPWVTTTQLVFLGVVVIALALGGWFLLQRRRAARNRRSRGRGSRGNRGGRQAYDDYDEQRAPVPSMRSSY